MIAVEGFNGEKYKGETEKQIVEEMRRASWGGNLSDGIAGFMRQVAKRVFDWSGDLIRSNSSKNFLTDLAKANLIKFKELP